MQFEDALQFRHQYQTICSSEPKQSLLIVTPGSLNHLPYDLWQQGQHLDLALHNLFPHLDYPTLQQLRPGHLAKLAQVEAMPESPLSPNQTRDFLLRTVFDAASEQLVRPAGLLLWLDGYHSTHDPMPPDLADHLLASLRRASPLAAWPLDDLLTNAEAYRHFVQQAWGRYVTQQTRESGPLYAVGVPFAVDPELQDALPRLLRTGTLTPVVVDDLTHLPAWSRPAVAVDEIGKQLRQIEEGLAALDETLSAGPIAWESWQGVARRWATLTLLWYGANLHRPSSLRERWAEIERSIDLRFADWLTTSYTRLGSRTLPPHHLFHVLPSLAQRMQTDPRVALLVMDGMSLADWLLIKSVWQERHPTWQINEHLLLAQVPSITAVSRQALIGGRRPVHFADSLTHNRRDADGWRQFWLAQGLAENAIEHRFLPNRQVALALDHLDRRHLRALCLISTVIDEMIHGATQGTGDLIASLRLWLNENSPWLEGLIDQILGDGYQVMLASDHGHVAAVGLGQPQEGVTVESRSKRARLYANADFAQTVHRHYPHTLLWSGDSLLPDNWWVLMPQMRYAFAPEGQQVLSHGGLTIDEMVVPLVSIVGQTVSPPYR